MSSGEFRFIVLTFQNLESKMKGLVHEPLRCMNSMGHKQFILCVRVCIECNLVFCRGRLSITKDMWRMKHPGIEVRDTESGIMKYRDKFGD